MSECVHTCVNCVFKELSLLDGLNPSELAILESNRTTANFKKGETIYKEGSNSNQLLCLNSGKVKIIAKTDSLDEQIINILKPVDSLGFQALLSGSKYQDTAVALENSGVCSINKKDLFKVIENNNAFALKVIDYQAKMLNLSDSRLITLTNKNMRARLSETLILLENIFGTSENGTLNIILKRKELAGLSNMTTANAIRTLSSFSKDGLVRLEKKDIVITNFEQLEQIAAFG